MVQTIMVVEDEQDIRFPLVAKLQAEGFTVIEAINGNDAMKKVKANQIDLIILDIVLPFKSGLEFLRELREVVKNNVPVIVSSNLNEQKYLDTAGSLNVAGYIIKSNTSLDQIVQMVRAVGQA